MMGELYNCFKQIEKQSSKDWFMKDLGFVKLSTSLKTVRYSSLEGVQTAIL